MGDPETKSEELKKEEEEIEPKSNGIVAEKHDDSKESGEEKSSDQTSSDYYWNSYAHFGIHEVGSAALGNDVLLLNSTIVYFLL